MKCTKCFTENLPNAVYCAKCGARMAQQTVVQQKPEQRTQIVQSSPTNFRREITEILLGRSPNCDIPVDDPGVSSKHARIFVDNNKIYVEDLRSLNGTFVNGRRISSRIPLRQGDQINLGNYSVNMNNASIAYLFSNYSSDSLSYSSGTLQLRLNTNWLGKIFYFIMVILYFFPWLTIRSTTESVSFTAFDFAFNRIPSDLSFMKMASTDYGPLHNLYLVIFLGLILGMGLSFFNLRISEKFNYVNILSIILLVLSVGYVYLVSSIDKLLGASGVVIQHNFAAYFFIFVCLISVFEGVLEYYISERKKYYG